MEANTQSNRGCWGRGIVNNRGSGIGGGWKMQTKFGAEKSILRGKDIVVGGVDNGSANNSLDFSA